MLASADLCPFSGLPERNNLVEILDDKLRPLGAMPGPEVLSQGLRHFAIALQLRDQAGRWLLARHKGQLTFSAYALLAAGEAREEFALKLLQSRHNLAYCPLRQLACFTPAPETLNGHVTLFIGVLPATFALEPASSLILADNLELEALQAAEYPFEPFFLRVFREILSKFSG